MDLSKLQDAGFVSDEELRAALEARAGLSDNGPHVVLHALKRGNVSAWIEQNSVREGGAFGPMITHPAVLVLDGPNGRVACSPEDLDLALRVADQLG